MKTTIKQLLPTVAFLLVVTLVLCGCTQPQTNNELTPASRESSIPQNAQKITPETDHNPPLLHSDEWNEPVPLPAQINTAGGEDSAFILPDGNTLYFWFTPNVSVPPEKQVIDGVTGIYSSKKINGQWTAAERIVLQDTGKLALDGCPCLQDGILWFCSAREGYSGVHFFTAEYQNNVWTDWQYADTILNDEYQVGELHIAENGTELYFHSSKDGGAGLLDIWMTTKSNGVWQEPINVEAVNSAENDGWPFVTQNGKELWFTRTYLGSPALYRSKKSNDGWQEPELILSQFAGEPSLDNQGNIYFSHHFYENNTMIEADIYVAYHT